MICIWADIKNKARTLARANVYDLLNNLPGPSLPQFVGDRSCYVFSCTFLFGVGN